MIGSLLDRALLCEPSRWQSTHFGSLFLYEYALSCAVYPLNAQEHTGSLKVLALTSEHVLDNATALCLTVPIARDTVARVAYSE